MSTLPDNLKFAEGAATAATPSVFNEKFNTIINALRKAGPLGLSTSTDVLYVNEADGTTLEAPAEIELKANLDVPDDIKETATIEYTIPDPYKPYGTLVNKSDPGNTGAASYWDTIVFQYTQTSFTSDTSLLIKVLADITFGAAYSSLDQTVGGSFNIAPAPQKGEPASDHIIADFSLSSQNPVIDYADEDTPNAAKIKVVDTTIKKAGGTYMPSFVLTKKQSDDTYTEVSTYGSLTELNIESPGDYKLTLTALDDATQEADTITKEITVHPFSAFNLHPYVIDPSNPHTPNNIGYIETSTGYVDDVDDLIQYLDIKFGHVWNSYKLIQSSEETLVEVPDTFNGLDGEAAYGNYYLVIATNGDEGRLKYNPDDEEDGGTFYIPITGVSRSGDNIQLHIPKDVTDATGTKAANLYLTPGANKYTVSIKGEVTEYYAQQTVYNEVDKPAISVRFNEIPTSMVETEFTVNAFCSNLSVQSAKFTTTINHADSIDFKVANPIRVLETTVQPQASGYNSLHCKFGHTWNSATIVNDGEAGTSKLTFGDASFAELLDYYDDYVVFVKIGNDIKKYNNTTPFFPIKNAVIVNSKMEITVDSVDITEAGSQAGTYTVIPPAQAYILNIQSNDGVYKDTAVTFANTNNPPTEVVFNTLPSPGDVTDFDIETYTFENGIFSEKIDFSDRPYASVYDSSDEITVTDTIVSPATYGASVSINTVGTGSLSDADLKGFNIKWASTPTIDAVPTDNDVSISNKKIFVPADSRTISLNEQLHRNIKVSITPVYIDGKVSANTLYVEGKTGSFNASEVNKMMPISVYIDANTISNNTVLALFPLKKPIYITDLYLSAPSTLTGDATFKLKTSTSVGGTDTIIGNGLTLGTSDQTATASLESSASEGSFVDSGDYLTLALDTGSENVVTGNYTLNITYNG